MGGVAREMMTVHKTRFLTHMIVIASETGVVCSYCECTTNVWLQVKFRDKEGPYQTNRFGPGDVHVCLCHDCGILQIDAMQNILAGVSSSFTKIAREHALGAKR